MSIYTLIASGSAAALHLIRKFVAMPSLAGVRIEPTVFEPEIQSAVSKKVLVDLTLGKKTVNDNVAPGPHEWEIEGYIGGLPFEMSSVFMPSLRAFRDAIDAAVLSRQILTLIDLDYKSWPVLVERFRWRKTPDVANRIYVMLSLSEVNSLSVSISVGEIAVVKNATPDPGTADGAAADEGTAVTAQQGHDSIIGGWLTAAGVNWQGGP